MDGGAMPGKAPSLTLLAELSSGAALRPSPASYAAGCAGYHTPFLQTRNGYDTRRFLHLSKIHSRAQMNSE